MTPSSYLRAAIIRIVALGVVIALYMAVIAPALSARDAAKGAVGANIGIGLIIFAIVSGIALIWAFLDRRHWPVTTVVSVWALTGVLVGVGWLAARAISADSSMTPWGAFRADLSMIPFVTGLILVPAAVGALVGGLLQRTPSGPRNPLEE